jgi:anti-sigma B factor antagonist
MLEVTSRFLVIRDSDQTMARGLPKASPMEFDKNVTDDRVRFRIRGELDALSADLLRAPFSDVLRDQVGRVELDLSELKLIDSSGAGAIVWMYKQLRQRGRTLTIIGICGQPRAIFELLGLDRVFTLEKVA